METCAQTPFNHSRGSQLWWRRPPSCRSPARGQPAPHLHRRQGGLLGRVYDRAHLTAHPQQKVTSLHVLRSLGERREAENWQPDQRDELIKKFREDGAADVLAFVTFRDRRGTFYNSPHATRRPKVLCYIDCDGGFQLKRANPASLLLVNEGFACRRLRREVEQARRSISSRARRQGVPARQQAVAVCRREQRRCWCCDAAARSLQGGRGVLLRRDYDEPHWRATPRSS
jgi:hypothetical protein